MFPNVLVNFICENFQFYFLCNLLLNHRIRLQKNKKKIIIGKQSMQ